MISPPLLSTRCLSSACRAFAHRPGLAAPDNTDQLCAIASIRQSCEGFSIPGEYHRQNTRAGTIPHPGRGLRDCFAGAEPVNGTSRRRFHPACAPPALQTAAKCRTGRSPARRFHLCLRYPPGSSRHSSHQPPSAAGHAPRTEVHGE